MTPARRSGLRRVLPHPKLFLCLVAMWLLLNESVSAGQILLGSLIALGGTWVTVALEPEPVSVGRPAAMLRLAFRVLVDIFRSNLAVGLIILGLGRKDRKAGFMTVPLDLTDRYGLTLLSIILTATPGTLWLNYDPSRRTLRMHVLDLVDEAKWGDLIKERYERLLIEIFE